MRSLFPLTSNSTPPLAVACTFPVKISKASLFTTKSRSRTAPTTLGVGKVPLILPAKSPFPAKLTALGRLKGKSCKA